MLYMKGSLAVYISAVDVSFSVLEKGDGVVDVGVVDGMKDQVGADLLNFAYHFYILISL